MDRGETLKIFSVIKANYGNFFKNMPKADAEAMVNLWTDMFSDKPYHLVGQALKAYIASDISGYPPNVGQINEQIKNLIQQNGMTEYDAITTIRKAMSNSIYNSQQEFDKLPKIIQRLVGSPNQLKEWATMDMNEFETVVASNLMRSYKVIKKEETEKAMLPKEIKKLIDKGIGV